MHKKGIALLVRSYTDLPFCDRHRLKTNVCAARRYANTVKAAKSSEYIRRGGRLWVFLLTTLILYKRKLKRGPSGLKLQEHSVKICSSRLGSCQVFKRWMCFRSVHFERQCALYGKRGGWQRICGLTSTETSTTLCGIHRGFKTHCAQCLP